MLLELSKELTVSCVTAIKDIKGQTQGPWGHNVRASDMLCCKGLSRPVNLLRAGLLTLARSGTIPH